MKAQRLQLSDKVRLHPHWMPTELKGLKPRLRRGQVYCVRDVFEADSGAQFIRLVGVTNPAGSNGIESGITAEAFSRVGPPRREISVAAPPSAGDGAVAIPLVNWKMGSDARWLELSQMQADAVEMIKAGREDEALALLTRTLEHDDPQDWLATCKEMAAEQMAAGPRHRKGRRRA